MGGKVLHLTKPTKLSIKNSNLVLSFDEQDVKVTLKDMRVLVFDTTLFSISGKVLELFAKNNIAVLFVDESHTPNSILTPYHQHSTMSEVAYAQISITKEFKGRVWQQIVHHKLTNQANVLKFFQKDDGYKKLINLAQNVQTADKNQDEAQGARLYWRELFDSKTFRREQGSQDIINSMLNYTYALIRATITREVSANGMLSVFGIWHKNRYNAFALADDLMEVFRPFCDIYVKLLLDKKYKNKVKLDTEIKRDLVKLLLFECVDINGGKSNLLKSMEIFVKEYKKVMMGSSFKSLTFPTIHVEFFKDECL